MQWFSTGWCSTSLQFGSSVQASTQYILVLIALWLWPRVFLCQTTCNLIFCQAYQYPPSWAGNRWEFSLKLNLFLFIPLLESWSLSWFFILPFGRILIESGSSKSNRAKKSKYISNKFPFVARISSDKQFIPKIKPY